MNKDPLVEVFNWICVIISVVVTAAIVIYLLFNLYYYVFVWLASIFK